jgi:hypothetical protein
MSRAAVSGEATLSKSRAWELADDDSIEFPWLFRLVEMVSDVSSSGGGDFVDVEDDLQWGSPNLSAACQRDGRVKSRRRSECSRCDQRSAVLSTAGGLALGRRWS